MTKELFRKEAIRHRTRASFGDVVLAAPLPTWIITGLLAVIMAAVTGFALLGSIDVDGTRISLWQWAIGRGQ